MLQTLDMEHLFSVLLWSLALTWTHSHSRVPAWEQSLLKKYTANMGIIMVIMVLKSLPAEQIFVQITMEIM